jgi:hypothetical protein
VVIIERYRTVFSTDVLEKRSEGASVREAMKGNLTNIAVVSALLLAVIIGTCCSWLGGWVLAATGFAAECCSRLGGSWMG